MSVQELYCHACGSYVQFRVNEDRDGAHVFACPKCGHEHCRIVRDGVITEARWDSRNDAWTDLGGVAYRVQYRATVLSTSTSSMGDVWSSAATTSTSTTGWY